MEDCQKIYNFSEIRNPLNMKDESPFSLSSGIISVIGKDSVNRDEEKNVGKQIQVPIDGLAFTDAKIKKEDKFIALDSFISKIDADDKNSAALNLTLLFTRLSEVAGREENVRHVHIITECFSNWFAISLSAVGEFKIKKTVSYRFLTQSN